MSLFPLHAQVLAVHMNLMHAPGVEVLKDVGGHCLCRIVFQGGEWGAVQLQLCSWTTDAHKSLEAYWQHLLMSWWHWGTHSLACKLDALGRQSFLYKVSSAKILERFLVILLCLATWRCMYARCHHTKPWQPAILLWVQQYYSYMLMNWVTSYLAN